MEMDREHKKMMKDYVKSISLPKSRHVIEWTAGELQEYDFDKYRLESDYLGSEWFLRMILKNHTVLILFTKRSIRLGKIFLRMRKVEPSNPPRYRENGWAIRNQSTREDKTAFGRNMTFLSGEPVSKWNFWRRYKSQKLKHR